MTPCKLSEARATCDGLHRLLRKINEAAVDGGNSSYELHALLASANNCVINLSTQLTLLESGAPDDSNIHPISRDTAVEAAEAEPEELTAVEQARIREAR